MTGATLTNLEVLVVAGGAPEHGPAFCGEGVEARHYFTVGDGDPNAFVNALQARRQIECRAGTAEGAPRLRKNFLRCVCMAARLPFIEPRTTRAATRRSGRRV